MKRKRSNPETRLQIVVMQYLQIAGVPDLMAFHIKNSGKESIQTGALLKKMGVKAGVADLFIGVPGQPPAFLELKSDKGTHTKPQMMFAEHCWRLGYRYEVASGIDRALAVLRTWGALRSGAKAA